MSPIRLSSILKIVEESQPPQRYYLGPIDKEICPQYIQLKCPGHLSMIIKSRMGKRFVVPLQIEITDMLTRVGTPQQVYAQLNAQLISKLMMGPWDLKPIIQWKSLEVTVIFRSPMWKVLVVSHHLSARAQTSIPLAAPSKRSHRSGPKPTAFTKAFVSVIRA